MKEAHAPSAAMDVLARAVSAVQAITLPPDCARWAGAAYTANWERCAAVLPSSDTYQRAVTCGSASGDPVFGATLALAERCGASRDDELRAYAGGSEVRMRVAAALARAASAQAWDERGTAGVIGAAVAAATLLRLGHERMIRVFGIAGSETIGFGCVRDTAAAAFVSGKAAANGVIAALLAADGFTACAGIDPDRAFLGLVPYPQGADPQWREAACESIGAEFGVRWDVLTERPA